MNATEYAQTIIAKNGQIDRLRAELDAAVEELKRVRVSGEVPALADYDALRNKHYALLVDRDRLAGEVERLMDRAVCSGCGQDTDEGGGCETPGCDLVPGGCEMIPSSDLPGALREAMERHNEERAEWREDWEQLRREANGAAAQAETYRAALERIAECPGTSQATLYAAGIARAALSDSKEAK